MTEPTVPVPVSLIKATIETADQQGLGSLASEYRAVLSQPDPTVESLALSLLRAGEFQDEPPRIEDKAPGTRFIGRHVDPEECGGVDHVWFVHARGLLRDQRSLTSDEGQRWSVDSIDPSTIRDVTPPEDAA